MDPLRNALLKAQWRKKCSIISLQLEAFTGDRAAVLMEGTKVVTIEN